LAARCGRPGIATDSDRPVGGDAASSNRWAWPLRAPPSAGRCRCAAGWRKADTAGGTLVWGMPAETDILDPHATGGWLTYDVTYQIFEGFAKEDLTDPNVAYPPLVPGLATSWISPTTACSTRSSCARASSSTTARLSTPRRRSSTSTASGTRNRRTSSRGEGLRRRYTKWIKDVEVLGPMAIKVTLTQPNYEWLRAGLQSYGQPLMLSPTAVQKFGNDGIALNPIGTGPFKFVQREQGVKTVIERNDDYWGRKAKLARIVFRPLQDPATRSNALRTGEVHMINTPVWDDIDGLVKDGFVLTTNKSVPYIYFLYLNMKQGPMQDIRVRQAINMAVDREGIARGHLSRHRAAGIRHAVAGNLGLRSQLPQLRVRSGQGQEADGRRRPCRRLQDPLSLPGIRHGHAGAILDPARPQEDRHRCRTEEVRMDHLHA